MSRRSRDVWPETYRLLSTRDPAVLTPDELEAIADSAWLVCHLNESLAARQQAYTGYEEINDHRSAVRAAWRLFWDHLYNGDKVVALGWLRRAHRHLAAVPESAEHGFVALAESELALNRGAGDEAEAHAVRAIEVARGTAPRASLPSGSLFAVGHSSLRADLRRAARPWTRP